MKDFKDNRKIIFYLGNRYFRDYATKSGMTWGNCVLTLVKAFGVQHSEAARILSAKSEGIKIKCRPDQFARFIIYRSDLGDCTIEVRDLDAQFVEKPLGIYAAIAKKMNDARPAWGVSSIAVQEVLSTTGFNAIEVREHFRQDEQTFDYDVSHNGTPEVI